MWCAWRDITWCPDSPVLPTHKLHLRVGAMRMHTADMRPLMGRLIHLLPCASLSRTPAHLAQELLAVEVFVKHLDAQRLSLRQTIYWEHQPARGGGNTTADITQAQDSDSVLRSAQSLPAQGKLYS